MELIQATRSKSLENTFVVFLPSPSPLLQGVANCLSAVGRLDGARAQKCAVSEQTTIEGEKLEAFMLSSFLWQVTFSSPRHTLLKKTAACTSHSWIQLSLLPAFLC